MKWTKLKAFGFGCLLAIVAFLVCLVLIVLTSHPIDTVDETDKLNLRTLGLDMQVYEQDYPGRLPPLLSSESLTRLKITDNVMKDPILDHTDNKPLVTNPYFSGAKDGTVSNPHNAALIYTFGTTRRGRAVLFADFTVRFVNAAEWESIKRISHIR